eukprot:scaffold61074_cov23-Tisochrysis_lutea.AAC.1
MRIWELLKHDVRAIAVGVLGDGLSYGFSSLPVYSEGNTDGVRGVANESGKEKLNFKRGYAGPKQSRVQEIAVRDASCEEGDT